VAIIYVLHDKSFSCSVVQSISPTNIAIIDFNTILKISLSLTQLYKTSL